MCTYQKKLYDQKKDHNVAYNQRMHETAMNLRVGENVWVREYEKKIRMSET